MTPYCPETIYNKNFRPYSDGLFEQGATGDFSPWITKDPGVGYRHKLKLGGFITDRWELKAVDGSTIGDVNLSLIGYYLSVDGPKAAIVPLSIRLPDGAWSALGNGGLINVSEEEFATKPKIVMDLLISYSWSPGSVISMNLAFPSTDMIRRYSGDGSYILKNGMAIDRFYEGKEIMVDNTLNGKLDKKNCIIMSWNINDSVLPPEALGELEPNK